jgi:hypothetical protein
MNIKKQFNIPQRYSCIKFDFPRIICRKSELSENYIVERRAFLEYNSQKVTTFHGLYPRKACFYSRLCGKACNFVKIIPCQGRLYRGKILGKFWLFLDYPAERHAFAESQNLLWIILQTGMPFCRIIGNSQNCSWRSQENVMNTHRSFYSMVGLINLKDNTN